MFLKKKKTIIPHTLQYPLLNDTTPIYLRETYNSLRTNLIFFLNQAEKKQIVVTSAIPTEGKTTTACNMAILFAQTNAKVLLIDADMRRSKLHRVFNCQHAPGLSEVLAGLSSFQDSIQSTHYENLFVLSAGTIPPNPSELLLSDHLDVLLQELSKIYDYVIIDTPPVKSVTDASIITAKVLGAIVISRCNYSSKPEVAEAVREIESIGGKVLGYVLNDVEESTGPTYRRSRYSYRYGVSSRRYYSYYYKKSATNNDDVTTTPKEKE